MALAEVMTEIEKGMTRQCKSIQLHDPGQHIPIGAFENAVPGTVVSWMQRLFSNRVIEDHLKQ